MPGKRNIVLKDVFTNEKRLFNSLSEAARWINEQQITNSFKSAYNTLGKYADKEKVAYDRYIVRYL